MGLSWILRINQMLWSVTFLCFCTCLCCFKLAHFWERNLACRIRSWQWWMNKSWLGFWVSLLVNSGSVLWEWQTAMTCWKVLTQKNTLHNCWLHFSQKKPTVSVLTLVVWFFFPPLPTCLIRGKVVCIQHSILLICQFALREECLLRLKGHCNPEWVMTGTANVLGRLSPVHCVFCLFF